jgi:hypothetical protein
MSPRLWIGLSLIAMITSLASFAYWITKPGLPACWVSPQERRIIAEPSVQKVTASYNLHYRGSKDLMIIGATTSCSCSVVSIFPKVLRSGGFATITIEGTPPPVGKSLSHKGNMAAVDDVVGG